jgi:hypothetical protein
MSSIAINVIDTHTHTYTYTHTYIHTYTHTHTHTHTHTYIHAHTHTSYTHTYMHAHTHTRTRVCVCVCVCECECFDGSSLVMIFVAWTSTRLGLAWYRLVDLNFFFKKIWLSQPDRHTCVCECGSVFGNIKTVHRYYIGEKLRQMCIGYCPSPLSGTVVGIAIVRVCYQIIWF